MNNPLARWLLAQPLNRDQDDLSLQDSTRTLQSLRDMLTVAQGTAGSHIELGDVLRSHKQTIDWTTGMPSKLIAVVRWGGTWLHVIDYKAHLEELEDWCSNLGIEEISGSYRTLLKLQQIDDTHD